VSNPVKIIIALTESVPGIVSIDVYAESEPSNSILEMRFGVALRNLIEKSLPAFVKEHGFKLDSLGEMKEGN
jgi:hypothetical protein